MKNSEAVQYWNTRPEDAVYSVVTLPQSLQGTDDMHREAIPADELSKLFSACGDAKLIEFAGLYALMQLMHRFSGNRCTGIRVALKNNAVLPLIMEVPAEMSVKDAVRTVFGEYKQLYMAGQLTTEANLRYIPRKDEILDPAGIRYSFSEQSVDLPEQSEFLHLSKESVTLQAKAAPAYLQNALTLYKAMLADVLSGLKGLSQTGLLAAYENRVRALGCGETQNPADFHAYTAFAEAAARFPDAEALVCGAERFSYRELHQAILTAAESYRKQGVKQGDIVPLVTDHNSQTIIRLYAIWSLGAIYAPLSVTQSAQKQQLIRDEIAAIRLTPEERSAKSHLIFTSGTTGKPKAVLIDRVGFGNLCNWYADTFAFGQQSSSLLMTNFLFDASVKNLVTPLITGGKLVIPDCELYDIDRMRQIIQREQVTHINTVPSLLDQLTEQAEAAELRSLEWVILGGESYHIRIEKMQQLPCKIANVYGPTEATDLATCCIISDKTCTHVPIGKPIRNKQIRILDAHNQLCPLYVKGEITIGGCGVADQYYNVDKHEVFLTDPQLGNLYRTGDFGMLDSDGNIWYMGRKDHQVKLHGQRIELEELEHIGRELPAVESIAAVLQNEQLLICYTEKEPIPKETLKACYARKLSRNLQPNDFIRFDRMPLTANGKIDRKKLAEMLGDRQENPDLVLPQTPAEIAVAQAWSAALGKDEISVDKPFFEAGGSSLLLNKLKHELDKRLPNQLTITDFFECTTIRKIAERISQT